MHNDRTATVLGIESSCDETAAAVVRLAGAGPGEILSNRVFGQETLHARFGGVVPEIAARAHAERVDLVAAEALGQYRQFRVVQGLIGALQDRLLRVNDAAVASLVTLTGQDFGLDTAAWLAWVGESTDLFVEATAYEYPVFQRDPTFTERVLPWRSPPNEITSEPVGAPRERRDGGES